MSAYALAHLKVRTHHTILRDHTKARRVLYDAAVIRSRRRLEAGPTSGNVGAFVGLKRGRSS